jgi:hypothetical protein
MYEVESYARERQIAGAELGVLRRERTAPVVVDFKAWLDDRATTLLPKSSTGKAVAYCRRHWTALTRFLDDPRLPLDNNLSERCLRTVAVGRKNYIFAGATRAPSPPPSCTPSSRRASSMASTLSRTSSTSSTGSPSTPTTGSAAAPPSTISSPTAGSSPQSTDQLAGSVIPDA